MADLLTRRRHVVLRRGRRTEVRRDVLTSSAAILTPNRMLRLRNFDWQAEAWNFYREGVGAFKYAMLWHAQTMSRVRLTTAVMRSDGEEPEPLPDGDAADLLRGFFGGNHSQYMYGMDIQLQVPGEGYVVGNPDPDDPDDIEWSVKSSTEMDITSGRARMPNGQKKAVDLWRIQVDEGVWETLPFEAHVFKQWVPDQEKSWQPDSPTRGAMRTLRTIDMLERRIVAMAVSRLASNGILWIPDEITFPVKPEYEEEPDPFSAELIDIAGKTIANPGSALAAIPLPIKVPAELIEKIRRDTFDNPFDERLLEILRFEYDQLATAMNMPKEVITGMGATSHWNAWTLDEQGIETHIKPPAEMICHGLTKGFLKPALQSIGAPTKTADGNIVVWYDTSQLDVPPDRSEAADAAYDRQAITREDYADAKGFSRDNVPKDSALREQLLLQMAKDPASAPAAIEELTGAPVAGAPTGPGGEAAPADEPAPVTGPPAQQPRTPAQPAPPTDR